MSTESARLRLSSSSLRPAKSDDPTVNLPLTGGKKVKIYPDSSHISLLG